MKKGVIILVVILAGILAFFYFGMDKSAKADNVLRVGTSADYPPYEYFHNGDIVGFDVDLIKAVANEMGMEAEVIDMDFSGLIPALQAGRIDVIVAAMSQTPEREKNVDFSNPYFYNYSAIISVKGDPIKSVNDLENKTIAIQLGSIHEGNLKNAEIKGLNIKSYNRLPEMVQELKSSLQGKKRIDGIALGVTEAQEVIKMEPQFQLTDLEIGDTCGIVMAKGSDLRSKINEALEILEKEGVINLLKEKWNLTSSPHEHN